MAEEEQEAPQQLHDQGTNCGRAFPSFQFGPFQRPPPYTIFIYSHNQKDPGLIDSYSDDFTHISGNFKRTVKNRPHFGIGRTRAILLLSFHQS